MQLHSVKTRNCLYTARRFVYILSCTFKSTIKQNVPRVRSVFAKFGGPDVSMTFQMRRSDWSLDDDE